MVAPNGARRTKKDHPAIPLSPRELGECAAACQAAGATAIHTHVRDEAGGHTLDADLYKVAIEEIRSRTGPDFFIQITTEAVGIFSPADQRQAVMDVVPPGASLALSELFPQNNPQEELLTAEFLHRCDASGIAIQWIFYKPEDFSRFLALRNEGKIPAHHHDLLFVLGRYTTGQVSDPADLLAFLSILEAPDANADFLWSVCAFGHTETAALGAAMALGGHVRVGYENNLWRPDQTVSKSNAERVEAIRNVAEILGIPVSHRENQS